MLTVGLLNSDHDLRGGLGSPRLPTFSSGGGAIPALPHAPWRRVDECRDPAREAVARWLPCLRACGIGSCGVSTLSDDETSKAARVAYPMPGRHFRIAPTTHPRASPYKLWSTWLRPEVKTRGPTTRRIWQSFPRALRDGGQAKAISFRESRRCQTTDRCTGDLAPRSLEGRWRRGFSDSLRELTRRARNFMVAISDTWSSQLAKGMETNIAYQQFGKEISLS